MFIVFKNCKSNMWIVRLFFMYVSVQYLIEQKYVEKTNKYPQSPKIFFER